MLHLGRKPVQMLNRKIFARIPHPSRLRRATFPPGEGLAGQQNKNREQGEPAPGGVCYGVGG